MAITKEEAQAKLEELKMSKEIFLYSEDKKYKCVVELADSLDNFGCSDYSMMVLFEEKENGTYIIAQARDKRLETEKDTLIDSLELEKNNLVGENAKLKQQLAESESKVKVGEFWHSAYQGKQLDYDKVYAELRQSYDENYQLKQQLADKEKQLLCKTWYKEYKNVMKANEDFYEECAKLREQLAEKDKEMEIYRKTMELWVKKCENQNQDKIDFAVNKLGKVKDIVLKETERIADEIHLDFEAGFESCYIFMQNQINKLITEIKGDKGCQE